MSSAMTEVAIRLAEPDRMAEQQIASVGQAVRRQVNHMNEAVSRALGRAGELEALVHNEVASLERSYTQNENRIRSLLDELSGERNALLNTSERVSHTMKELGTDIPMLIDKLGDQQVKLARFIEQAGQNLVGLEQSLNSSANHLAGSLGERTHEIAEALQGGVARLESALGGQGEALRHQLTSHAQHIETAFDGFAGGLDAALGQRTEEMRLVLEGTTEGLDQALAARTGEMQRILEGSTQKVDQALSERTEGLQAVLEEYTRALDATLEARQQGLDQQLIQRTKALDDAFSERLKLFDETILRSTIAIDSTVADKARALSTALESHATEISQVLGRQAGQLDEQLMHGVNAVRRASENVTKQSVKAIEGLAGQAELLRNLSENLVSQISSVTNRFDAQGQTIMTAANKLESANQRISHNLQQRQTELARTLEDISSKAQDIDKVMRAYPAQLEGSVNEFEHRARLAGEEIARSAEERQRLAQAEMERLKHAAEDETERAVLDLRNKFQNMSREVSAEIGSLQSRFSDSYDSMRQRARSTLADIETEQTRLKEELARLPEATRASAESVRQSLQEQLRALEQLSQLSSREAIRADISQPTHAPAQSQPARAPASRGITSVSQSLASEIAARNRAMQAGMLPAAASDGARDSWKLGELLARASQDDGHPAELDYSIYSGALDQTTASAIWSRFRAGQRGVMVRSIYTPEGRAIYDDVQRRYGADPAFRQAVERYLGDLQRLLREADQRDPSGRTSQGYIVSDQGRAYLFLAHASGLLA
jgi:ABC-type transporter Mla subunit MlaD